ncbi:MAG: hypothetical protein ACI9G1_000184 [Pirellulaceae bacterium]|jgi:hypothetical protein
MQSNFYQKENVMKNVMMLLAVAVVIGTVQFTIAEELTQRDQHKIAVQAICPVSGQQLGSHGQPIKAMVGEEEVFLCCKGCLKGSVNQQHWATIHANFTKAQAICPVMKKNLPNNPKWTIVQGQIIYICCPPCTKKIAADPATYLTKVNELYAAAVSKGKESRR